MKKIKVLTIFGTRPEAIKMAPIIKKFAVDNRFDAKVVVTAQHREMLDQVLDIFKIVPDYDLNIMKNKQTLAGITSVILEKLTPILIEEKPDVILVHGDTTTTYASALAAFYQKITIAHVEAGLRTWNKYSPFPEEMNRQLTDRLSDIYFAPTEWSRKNLESEHCPTKSIFVTGNTSIDALKYTIDADYHHDFFSKLKKDTKLVLVTMHRRENIGKPMTQVFRALARIAKENSDVHLLFPMHRNPKVREEAIKHLKHLNNVDLVEPLDVIDFHNFAKKSYLILTDSGGIQEEAPSLGVPVLVLRETTERPEGVSAGTLKLVGTNEKSVYEQVNLLLNEKNIYEKMANTVNPYGDGQSSNRILNYLKKYFVDKNLN